MKLFVPLLTLFVSVAADKIEYNSIYKGVVYNDKELGYNHLSLIVEHFFFGIFDGLSQNGTSIDVIIINPVKYFHPKEIHEFIEGIELIIDGKFNWKVFHELLLGIHDLAIDSIEAIEAIKTNYPSTRLADLINLIKSGNLIKIERAFQPLLSDSM